MTSSRWVHEPSGARVSYQVFSFTLSTTVKWSPSSASIAADTSMLVLQLLHQSPEKNQDRFQPVASRSAMLPSTSHPPFAQIMIGSPEESASIWNADNRSVS